MRHAAAHLEQHSSDWALVACEARQFFVVGSWQYGTFLAASLASAHYMPGAQAWPQALQNVLWAMTWHMFENHCFSSREPAGMLLGTHRQSDRAPPWLAAPGNSQGTSQVHVSCCRHRQWVSQKSLNTRATLQCVCERHI